jgi:hypothetical protein
VARLPEVNEENEVAEENGGDAEPPEMPAADTPETNEGEGDDR